MGIINTDGQPADQNLLEVMTSSIIHRGPTEGGIYLNGSLGIGNRRLAIIDLLGGKQPLSNENEQIWITYNGEIYNYKELQNELISKGHVFRTNSDSEVVIHAYETWGKRCVEHFRGMFAFAIADLSTNKLFLARDQMGIKPLFFISTSSYFAFASELQALRCIPGLDLEIDIEALDQYLFLQYIPAPRTIFQKVQKLEPAHRLSVSFDGNVSTPEEYWEIEFKPDHSKKENDWIEELEAVLNDSVKAHLVSDVPFGAFLSGGIDSSCIVSFMSKILNKPVKTFSIGFQEEGFNEIKYANEVSVRWGTDQYTEVLKPNALEILPSLVRHYGEPFGDSSAIPTYYVSQLAHLYVPMVLSGDGGDELFAGYGTYQGWVNLLTGKNRPLWRKIGRKLGEVINPSRYPRRNVDLKTWLHLVKYLNYQSRIKLWRPEFRKKCSYTIYEFEELFKRTNGFELCSKAQFMDIKTYLPYDILTKVDIATMMHGLEARTPLVDIRVAEFAATIPQEMNLVQNNQGLLQGKTILKKVIRRFFSENFINRPKMGFGVPLNKWFASDGELNQYLRDSILAENAKINSFFEPKEVKKLVDQNKSGPTWLLLFLNEWLNQLG